MNKRKVKTGKGNGTSGQIPQGTGKPKDSSPKTGRPK